MKNKFREQAEMDLYIYCYKGGIGYTDLSDSDKEKWITERAKELAKKEQQICKHCQGTGIVNE